MDIFFKRPKHMAWNGEKEIKKESSCIQIIYVSFETYWNVEF